MIPYDFTKQKRENITARMNDLLNDIASEEVSYVTICIKVLKGSNVFIIQYHELLKQAGLTEITEIIATKDDEVCI